MTADHAAARLDVKTERDVNLITGEEFVRISYRQPPTRRWTRVSVFPNDGQSLEQIEDLAAEIAEADHAR